MKRVYQIPERIENNTAYIISKHNNAMNIQKTEDLDEMKMVKIIAKSMNFYTQSKKCKCLRTDKYYG